MRDLKTGREALPASVNKTDRHYNGGYYPEIPAVLLASVARKCPNLRSMVFCESEPWSWVLYVAPAIQALSALATSLTPGQEVIGHIDVTQPFTYWLGLHTTSASPPAPSVPPSGYTINTYYDLRVYISDGFRPPVPQVQQLLLALREEPCWATCGRNARFGQLSIDLADITALCQRQIDSGNFRRIENISAGRVNSWDVDAFRSFASVASSLVSLDLVGETANFDSRRVGIGFTDIPDLVSTIRSCLPCLATLKLAVRGVDSAEADLRRSLSDTSLDSGGTIKLLHILTAPHSSPLLSTIRVLSGICASTAEIRLPHAIDETPTRASKKSIWTSGCAAVKARQEKEPTEYLRYLRS